MKFPKWNRKLNKNCLKTSVHHDDGEDDFVVNADDDFEEKKDCGLGLAWPGQAWSLLSNGKFVCNTAVVDSYTTTE